MVGREGGGVIVAVRMARGTAQQPLVTRSKLVLALREAERRGDRRLASELRRMLGGLTERNEIAEAAARQLDGAK